MMMKPQSMQRVINYHLFGFFHNAAWSALDEPARPEPDPKMENSKRGDEQFRESGRSQSASLS